MNRPTDRYRELAARYGTPLYVYDLDLVDEGHRALADAVPEGIELYYAFKANPHPGVARALREGAGGGARPCRAEISSPGELDSALAAGYTAAECLYTGPGKTASELEYAIGRGVRIFSVESYTDLQHVGAAALRLGAVARCLLRVNSAGTKAATTGIRMMGKPSQFGIDSETLPELMPLLTSVPGTEVVGAHFFTMSNAVDEAGLVGEFERTVISAVQLAEEVGLPLELLDIGGGFSSPYAVPGERAEYPKLASELERILDLHLPEWRAGTPRLAVESGRYLVGGSGFLVSGVVNVKDSRGNRFVILDAGINTLGGLSGLGRLLPAAVQLDGAEPEQRASLVGPLCTPGDSLGRDVQLPELAPGDVVVVPNVGAYGVSASLLGFLSRPAPVEVLVRGGEVVSATRLELVRTAAAEAAQAAQAAGAAGAAAR
ncbi:type III PLP-dependent enzyme [Kitasatospora phosalacinea]|uniref:Type III PLP-dependent enzyme n=1 Tax=Kitasatospora phosalacinea TaxID=2065 RepID=A0ABW6GWR2_9ACTN